MFPALVGRDVRKMKYTKTKVRLARSGKGGSVKTDQSERVQPPLPSLSLPSSARFSHNRASFAQPHKVNAQKLNIGF